MAGCAYRRPPESLNHVCQRTNLSARAITALTSDEQHAWYVWKQRTRFEAKSTPMTRLDIGSRPIGPSPMDEAHSRV
jgi:hypothetical protein